MITCKFDCKRCGVGPRPFQVRDRAEGENVVHWVQTAAIPAMDAAHKAAAPECTAERADLLIPVPKGDKGFGEPD